MESHPINILFNVKYGNFLTATAKSYFYYSGSTGDEIWQNQSIQDICSICLDERGKKMFIGYQVKIT